MRQFGYLRDRLGMFSLAVYAVNRLILLPHLGGYCRTDVPWAWPFLHSHLDDLLMMPAALPVMLWVQRMLGIRRQDRPPSWGEMSLHLAVWSVMCKVVGPFCLHIGVFDPWDLVSFAVGGVAACLWWNRPQSGTSAV